MPNCPICSEKHSPLLSLVKHIILIAISHHDDHERYLDLLTGEDISVWSHKNDAVVAVRLRQYYNKDKRLPTLAELENKYDNTSEIIIS